MRELKFRAWDKNRGKMISAEEAEKSKGNLLAIGLHGLPIAVDNNSFRDDEIVGWNIDHYATLMQFIGKKDKNGKEVYDSDVLKSYEGILWRVQWNEERAEFELAWCGGPQPVYYRHGLHLIKDTHCEIIGNIYENPGLIGGGEV